MQRHCRFHRPCLFLAVLLMLLLPLTSNAEPPMTVRLVIGEQTLSATLESSPTGQDFGALLPLTLKLRDYNHAEKISELPRKLSTKGAPEGYEPFAGDLVLFVPWGNLAIFYKDAAWYPGLVKIGRLTVGVDVLAGLEDGASVRIEKAETSPH